MYSHDLTAISTKVTNFYFTLVIFDAKTI